MRKPKESDENVGASDAFISSNMASLKCGIICGVCEECHNEEVQHDRSVLP